MKEWETTEMVNWKLGHRIKTWQTHPKQNQTQIILYTNLFYCIICIEVLLFILHILVVNQLHILSYTLRLSYRKFKFRFCTTLNMKYWETQLIQLEEIRLYKWLIVKVQKGQDLGFCTTLHWYLSIFRLLGYFPSRISVIKSKSTSCIEIFKFSQLLS